MTGTPIRSFLAVELPVELRGQLAHCIETLRPAVPEGLRWTGENGLHLTLKFLGDVEREVLPRLARSVAARLAPLAPFQCTLAGLGAFPHAREARVLWLGVSQGASELARIARKLDSAAAKLGVERERRPFRPHLTLGRLRQPKPLPLERLPAPEPMNLSVNEVVLFESRLSSAGASHIPLVRFPVGPGELDLDDLALEF